MDLGDIYGAYQIDRAFESLRCLGFNFVPGVGNINADLMIVGEAPGENEDRLKTPFVGKAGEILNSYLKRIELDRSTIFVTNVLKYRPSKTNRDPTPPEIQAGLKYLRQEIDTVKPKLVMAMGKIASKAFLPGTEPRKVRGRVIGYQGYKLLVTFHPMATVHQTGAREALRQQFETAKEVLEG